MTPIAITEIRVIDLRVPTSAEHIGSDAVNKYPDYCTAYCVLKTDAGAKERGLIFILGRGTEFCVSAVEFMASSFRGVTLESLTSDMNGLLGIVRRLKNLVAKFTFPDGACWQEQAAESIRYLADGVER